MSNVFSLQLQQQLHRLISASLLFTLPTCRTGLILHLFFLLLLSVQTRCRRFCLLKNGVFRRRHKRSILRLFLGCLTPLLCSRDNTPLWSWLLFLFIGPPRKKKKESFAQTANRLTELRVSLLGNCSSPSAPGANHLRRKSILGYFSTRFRSTDGLPPPPHLLYDCFH